MPVHLGFVGRTGCIMIREAKGARVFYTLSGEKGRNVLLLHGWGCDSSTMKSVANALEDHFQVMTPDFPGHGKSGRPPEPWGVKEYAECIIELITETGFRPCYVVAHSFGCRVASWIEAENPGFFGKIVFTGGAGIRPKPSAEAQKRSSRYKKLKSMYSVVGKLPGLGAVSARMEDKLRKKYGSPDYNALDEEMRKTFIKVINQDLTELYDSFRSSTLLIWGDADTETPLWMAREMEKRIPDSGLVILESGSHFAFLEQSARFNRIVYQFLKEDE